MRALRSRLTPVTLCPLCVRTAGGWWGRECTVSDNESEFPEQSRAVVGGTGQSKKKNSTSTQVRPCGTYKGFGHEARLVVHLLALRCQRTWSGKLGSG